jgi:hypothetical protein
LFSFLSSLTNLSHLELYRCTISISMLTTIISLTKTLTQLDFFRCINEFKDPIWKPLHSIHRFSKDSLNPDYFLHHSLVDYLNEFDCRSERFKNVIR